MIYTAYDYGKHDGRNGESRRETIDPDDYELGYREGLMQRQRMVEDRSIEPDYHFQYTQDPTFDARDF